MTATGTTPSTPRETFARTSRAVLPLFAMGALGAMGAMGVWCAGCWTPQVEGNHFENSKVNYTIGAPGPGWSELKIEQANGAWHNDALAASILVNSHCEGVADSPLAGLTNDLMMGMTDRNIESQQPMTSSKRDALETVATAKLDGVPRKLALFVLKKDGCVYDIVLDADPAHFDAAKDAYAKVRDGFDVGPRKDRG